MKIAIVTGSAGLIGSQSVARFAADGYHVVGLDNNMRRYFFGADGDTSTTGQHLLDTYDRYDHYDIDIRNAERIDQLFAEFGDDIAAVVHAAGQPSHDWSATEPLTDFAVNATGTLNVLEATRRHCPDAAFVFCSTNKVYGDNPNKLTYIDDDTRYDLLPGDRYYDGITETMSTDDCLRSVFGVSKTAADAAVVEYGRNFGLKTATFRCGTLTGVAHAAAELHGFLAYVMRCALEERTYNIYGYQGKQVRDVLCCHDLAAAFAAFAESPRSGGQIYNMGGGRDSNASVLEALFAAGQIVGRPVKTTYVEPARIGDHRWWISSTGKFRQHYPQWEVTQGVEQILTDMRDHHVQQQPR